MAFCLKNKWEEVQSCPGLFRLRTKVCSWDERLKQASEDQGLKATRPEPLAV